MNHGYTSKEIADATVQATHHAHNHHGANNDR